MKNLSSQNNPFISIIIPLYNENETLRKCHQKLCDIIDSLEINTEFVYVNDGSTDNTQALLNELHKQDNRISIIELSRNFGKEIAMTAGLDHANGDAVIIIDADLQDPPELIPTLIEEWQKGYDVVYARRKVRQGESFIKKVSAFLFYRIIHQISSVNIPEDTGDFRLLSRRAVDALKKLPEQHRFMKGLFSWIGFPQKAVLYDRAQRCAGKTKWNYWKLWNFAIEGITSFTTAPLKLSTYLGFLIAIFSFSYGIYIIINTLLIGNPVAGYPSEIVTILFLGGCQLMATGIIGEYLGRLFDEAKRGPLYLVNNYMPSKQKILSVDATTKRVYKNV